MKLTDAGVERPDTSAALRLLELLQRANPEMSRLHAHTIDQAILAKKYLERIQGGQWPAAPSDAKAAETKRALLSVAQLGDVLAQQRQARLALRVHTLRQHGATADSLAAIGAEPGELEHPLTREPLRLERRGAMDVLIFAASTSRVMGEFGGANDLVWRMPGGGK